MPQVAPGGQPSTRRPALLVAVGVAVVAALVLGVVLLARPGVLLAAQPCDAAPGSTLPGFDDVVGPNPYGATGLASATPGGQLCTYATAGATPETLSRPGGRVVLVTRSPRAVVDADPRLRERVHTYPTSSSGNGMRLPRSGVTAVYTPNAYDEGASTSVVCATSTDYWSVLTGRFGTTADDAAGLDTLLSALDCGPLSGGS